MKHHRHLTGQSVSCDRLPSVTLFSVCSAHFLSGSPRGCRPLCTGCLCGQPFLPETWSLPGGQCRDQGPGAQAHSQGQAGERAEGTIPHTPRTTQEHARQRRLPPQSSQATCPGASCVCVPSLTSSITHRAGRVPCTFAALLLLPCIQLAPSRGCCLAPSFVRDVAQYSRLRTPRPHLQPGPLHPAVCAWELPRSPAPQNLSPKPAPHLPQAPALENSPPPSPLQHRPGCPFSLVHQVPGAPPLESLSIHHRLPLTPGGDSGPSPLSHLQPPPFSTLQSSF